VKRGGFMKKMNIVLTDRTAGEAGPEFIMFIKKSILMSMQRRGMLTEQQCERCIRHLSEKKR
jgi:hypothetical protein